MGFPEWKVSIRKRLFKDGQSDAVFFSEGHFDESDLFIVFLPFQRLSKEREREEEGEVESE